MWGKALYYCDYFMKANKIWTGMIWCYLNACLLYIFAVLQQIKHIIAVKWRMYVIQSLATSTIVTNKVYAVVSHLPGTVDSKK